MVLYGYIAGHRADEGGVDGKLCCVPKCQAVADGRDIAQPFRAQNGVLAGAGGDEVRPPDAKNPAADAQGQASGHPQERAGEVRWEHGPDEVWRSIEARMTEDFTLAQSQDRAFGKAYWWSRSGCGRCFEGRES